MTVIVGISLLTFVAARDAGAAHPALDEGKECLDIAAATFEPNDLVPAGTSGCPVRQPGVLRQSAAVDQRTHISPATGWPWRAIAHLSVSTANGSYTCSGYFVGPHTVMTAAHCLYDASFGGSSYAQSVEVTPGRDDSSKPFGSQSTTTFSVANGYILFGTNAYDWGLVTLPNDVLGNKVGGSHIGLPYKVTWVPP